ncbi:fluoride efflux transporter CrcB [Commensalibacter nepenthis]|uniref:Fluoride-specific ion channel FluC n=1 Tax=Commensalibacter nepenthis TaxID=3043872 RepID=A0ABT6Q7B9_9PROT|nr:fluoride efflux transporter CrcB [Commensalibacter sp. TBRC 10068]MDI2112782.1 fluoride efflux transporter CrcB [Commensalibacter sp. TBRC 10068]
MFNSILMISSGGALGCLLRWWLGLSLNALFPYMPLGTFVANCIAGYLIGVAMAIFLLIPSLEPWWLFIVTGFLGGLSTFSTFSLEVAMALQEGRFFWAGTEIVTHVVCSVVLTILGMVTVNSLR